MAGRNWIAFPPLRDIRPETYRALPPAHAQGSGAGARAFRSFRGGFVSFQLPRDGTPELLGVCPWGPREGREALGVEDRLIGNQERLQRLGKIAAPLVALIEITRERSAHHVLELFRHIHIAIPHRRDLALAHLLERRKIRLRHEEALAADQHGQENAYLATAPDDFATRVVWAGEGVDLINDVPTASEIIERLIAHAVETLTQGFRLVR